MERRWLGPESPLRPIAECRFYREGDWSFLVHPEIWSQGLWTEVLKHLGGQVRSHHPQTKRLHYPAGDSGREFYLKIYHRPDPLGTIKDLFRNSKAFLALRQARAMLLEGFHAPFTVAAGEKRTFRFIRQAFLLTLSLQGTPLPDFLKENFSHPLDTRNLKKKRACLKQLALEIRRLHQSGFVHGDLVPYNILVQAHGEELNFYYMDNDRTRRYPSWFPYPLWKRNLVQLNRVFLPEISQQDRVRFLHYYLGCKFWGKSERRLFKSLDEMTRGRIRRIYRQ